MQFVEGGVAVDGRGADQLDVRRQRRDHQGDGVVRAGIDVEDDPGRHGVTCTVPYMIGWTVHLKKYVPASKAGTS